MGTEERVGGRGACGPAAWAIVPTGLPPAPPAGQLSRPGDHLPPDVARAIRRYVTGLDGVRRPGSVGLVQDLHGAFAAPGIRTWLSVRSGRDRRAAATSWLFHCALRRAPDLARRYVGQLLPEIGRVVGPLAGLFGLSLCDVGGGATWDARRDPSMAALLTPLAAFFLHTVARGELAWDMLTDRSSAPPGVRRFLWTPSREPLPDAVWGALVAHCGSRLDRRTLLDSPAVHYLLRRATPPSAPPPPCPCCGGPGRTDAPPAHGGRDEREPAPPRPRGRGKVLTLPGVDRDRREER